MSSSTLTRNRPNSTPAGTVGRLLVLAPTASATDLQPIVLAPGRYHLGSDKSCDICVPFPGVAPRHCLIVVGPQRSVVKALAPLTWLNDGVLREATLQSGDRLIAGPIEWMVDSFEQDSEAGDAPGATRASDSSVALPWRDASARIELSQAAQDARADWQRHRDRAIAETPPSPAPAQETPPHADLQSQRAHLKEVAESLVARENELVARESDVRCKWDELQATWSAAHELDRAVRAERVAVAAQREHVLAERQSLGAVRRELDDVRADLERRAQALTEQEQSLQLRADDVSEAHTLAASRSTGLEQRESQLAEQLQRLAASEAAVCEREQSIANREADIEQREQVRSQSAQRLDERQHELGERERHLSEQADRLVQSDAERERQSHELADRQQQLADHEHRLAAAEQEMALRRQKLADLEQQSTQAEQRRIERETELAERERRLSEQADRLVQCDAERERKAHELADRDQQLAEREQAVAQHEQRLQDQESRLEQRDHQLVERAEEVSRGESARDRQSQELANRDEQLAERERQLAARGEDVQQREARSHQLEQDLAGRQTALAQREQALAECERKLSEREKTLSVQSAQDSKAVQQDEQWARCERELSDRRQQFELREHAQGKREQEVTCRIKELEVRERRLNEQSAEFVQRETEAGERTIRLDERERELAQQAARLEQRAAAMEHQERELSGRQRAGDESREQNSLEQQAVLIRQSELEAQAGQLQSDRDALAHAQHELELRWGGIEREQAALKDARLTLDREQATFAEARDELQQLRAAQEANEAIWTKRRTLLDAREQDLENRAEQLDRASTEFAEQNQMATHDPNRTLSLGPPPADLVNRLGDSGWLAAVQAINQAASGDLPDEQAALSAVREEIEFDRRELAAMRAEWDAKVEADQRRRGEIENEQARLQSEWDAFHAARVALEQEQEEFAEQRRELCRQLREFAVMRAGAHVDETPAAPNDELLDQETAAAENAGFELLDAELHAEARCDEPDAVAELPEGFAANPGEMETVAFSEPDAAVDDLSEVSEPQPAATQWWPQQAPHETFITDTGVYDAGAALAEDRSDETIAWSEQDRADAEEDPEPEAAADFVESEREIDSVTALRARLAAMFGLSQEQISKSRLNVDCDASESADDDAERTNTPYAEETVDGPLEVEAAAEPADVPFVAEVAACEQEIGEVSADAAAEEPTELPLPAPHDASASDDDAIASYMAKLLARSRSKIEVPDDLQSATRATEAGTNPIAPLLPDHTEDVKPIVPKTIAPEEKEAMRANLDSFRELANISARSAVAKHQSTKLQTVVQVKLIVLAIAAGVTLVLWIAGWFSAGSYFAYTVAAAIATIVMLTDVVRTVLAISRLRSLEASGEYEAETTGHLSAEDLLPVIKAEKRDTPSSAPMPAEDSSIEHHA